MELELVICTYNRAPELFDCLHALRNQKTSFDDWGIIVVNNFTQPLNDDIITIINEMPNARMAQEIKPGLSRARNRGIQVSRAEWLGFLDDDAKVQEDFIERAMTMIRLDHFDCFGGHIRSQWKYGRPRWMAENFGSKPILRSTSGEIEQGYNWGSNIFIRKEALIQAGGFPEDVGLRGTDIGYSAENIVQMKLREMGKVIGYDPALVVDHAVMPDKLDVSWHIKAAYATGRDGSIVFAEQYGWRGMFKTLQQCMIIPVRSIWNWLSQKDYYSENVVLDIGKTWALFIGKLRSKF